MTEQGPIDADERKRRRRHFGIFAAALGILLLLAGTQFANRDGVLEAVGSSAWPRGSVCSSPARRCRSDTIRSTTPRDTGRSRLPDQSQLRRQALAVIDQQPDFTLWARELSDRQRVKPPYIAARAIATASIV